MSFPIISKGLDKGFHLELDNTELIAVRNQKGRYFSRTLTEQTAKERAAVQAVTELMSNNFKDFDAHSKGMMYAAVNKRYKKIRAQTSGIIAQIKSLSRTSAHNRELKRLRDDYYALQQTFSKMPVDEYDDKQTYQLEILPPTPEKVIQDNPKPETFQANPSPVPDADIGKDLSEELPLIRISPVMLEFKKKLAF